MPAVQPLLNTHYDRSRALGNEITELFGFITAATYELLVKIREFDQEKLWQLEGVCSCAHWLNWKCGIGMTAARVKVRVANALGDLPKVSEAFRLGEISYSKVRAITRVATPENEDYLLMIAHHGTAHHVETVVSGYRRACRLNDAEIAEKQFEARSFSYRYDDDGSLVFNGRLPPEVGAMLMKAIDSAVDSNKSDKDDSAESWESISSRRADAIAEMSESYLKNGPASSSSADRYQVMIHVTAETPESDDSAESSTNTPDRQMSYLESGPHVTAETSRRVCCDTSVIRIIEDESGEPLSIGRKSRVVPPGMRRALQARDKQCRFPGCTHQHFIDAHHIEHWADGGESSLDNLVLLCRFHHRLVHEGGFGCEKNYDGKTIFRNQIGVPIDESGYAMPPIEESVVVYLKEKLEDRHIHAQSCVTRWQGEKMDKGLAVANLWDLTRPDSND